MSCSFSGVSAVWYFTVFYASLDLSFYLPPLTLLFLMSAITDKLDECIAKAFETKTDDLDVNQLEAREYSADDDASLLRFLVDMKVGIRVKRNEKKHEWFDLAFDRIFLLLCAHMVLSRNLFSFGALLLFSLTSSYFAHRRTCACFLPSFLA